ncbi:hypothetical protein pb186bvf_006337 [Paramecium bursaria]
MSILLLYSYLQGKNTQFNQSRSFADFKQYFKLVARARKILIAEVKLQLTTSANWLTQT